jgi:hypothetical protein
MNSGFQHTIFNHEVAPPDHCWEKITRELDDSALHYSFPKKLQEAAITPPANTWDKIAAELAGSSSVSVIAAKLQQAAVMPPPYVWDNIETELDNTQYKTPKRNRSILRYAAAAVMMGLLAWGASLLLNNNNIDTTAGLSPANKTDSTEPVITAQPPIPGEDVATISAEAAIEEARNDAALEASKKTYARLDVNTVQKKIKNVSAFNFGVTAEDEYDENAVDKSTDISKRYIILMTPDGHFIRMSKKLKDLVCCISGEEMDEACLDQLKRWREKILSSSAIHAPGNFADILNLVTSMQDNNQ